MTKNRVSATNVEKNTGLVNNKENLTIQETARQYIDGVL